MKNSIILFILIFYYQRVNKEGIQYDLYKNIIKIEKRLTSNMCNDRLVFILIKND